jgi:Spy/CpxP family protein refolding chaperone
VWLLATAALLLAFVAGALAGAAYERIQARDRPRPPRGPHHFAEMMQRRYGLSDAQERKVDAIVQRRRPRVDSLMATIQPQLRAAYDSTSIEIRGVLTPSQRLKFDQDELRRRRERAQSSASPAPSSARP